MKTLWLCALITVAVLFMTCSCARMRQSVVVAPERAPGADEPALFSIGALEVGAGGDDLNEYY